MPKSIHRKLINLFQRAGTSLGLSPTTLLPPSAHCELQHSIQYPSSDRYLAGIHPQTHLLNFI